MKLFLIKIKSCTLNPDVRAKKRNSLKFSLDSVRAFCSQADWERINREGFKDAKAPMDPRLAITVEAAEAAFDIQEEV